VVNSPVARSSLPPGPLAWFSRCGEPHTVGADAAVAASKRIGARSRAASPGRRTWPGCRPTRTERDRSLRATHAVGRSRSGKGATTVLTPRRVWSRWSSSSRLRAEAQSSPPHVFAMDPIGPETEVPLTCPVRFDLRVPSLAAHHRLTASPRNRCRTPEQACS